MTTLCLYLAVTPVSVIAFQNIENAHAMLSSASFVANTKVTGLAQDTAFKYEMKYRWPSELRLRTISPSTGKTIRERIIEPTRVIDYDPALAQYTVESRTSGEPLGKTLASLEQELDDLLLAYTDPEGMSVWMTDMVKLPGWVLTGDARKFVLTYRRADKRILLEANKPGSTLKKVDITTGAQRLVCDIAYAPTVTGLAFHPPSGACEVPVFDREMKPPKYKDAAAQNATHRMFDAYTRLESLGFEVVRDSGKTKVQMRGRFVRQEDEAAVWTYDGKTLTYCDKSTGAWYVGSLKFTDVIDAVAKLGTRVDPTVRLLMTDFNPYRKRLGDGSVVKVAGTMPLEGKTVTILECESDNALVTLFVREDGLVASSSSRAKRPTGDPEETVDLHYTYFNVPRDVAARQRLRLPIDKKPTTLKPEAAD
jgi:hypothetical protein